MAAVRSVGSAGGVQELPLLTRDARGAVTTERRLPVRFVPMVRDPAR